MPADRQPAPPAHSPKRVRAWTRSPAYNVRAEASWMGDDLLIALWGGDRPHIGAVAAAQPRPSLADPAVRSATASVLVFPGHKEDVVAKAAAETLAAALDRTVVVAAGLHWDDLDEHGIQTALGNCRRCILSLLRKLAP